MKNKDDEQILVVKSDVLFKDGTWQGLKTDNLDYYVDLIKRNCEFKRRGDVENDNSFQQIIPYILFNYQDKYFLYRYLSKAGEQRLKNDYIIGVGGHINKDDIKEGGLPAQSGDVLEAGRDREWDEEVKYEDNLNKKLIGILNDDRRPVEAVHLGLVYLFSGETPNIAVKEIDKMAGELINRQDLGAKLEGTEGWAPLIYNEYLKNLK
jgi:predicted NUDIX family phosphoesterase